MSVLVIDTNRVRASIIEEGLLEAGHEVVAVLLDVNGVAREIAERNPDVIVINLGNPNRDMLENIFQLSRAVARPIAMFVDHSDQASIEAAVEAGVSAYIVDGLRKERVKPILDMAVSRFRAYSRMAAELKEARDALESRQVIEKAKGILMRSRGLSEEEAHALLRKTAMSQNRKIGDVAQGLIMAFGMLEGGA